MSQDYSLRCEDRKYTRWNKRRVQGVSDSPFSSESTTGLNMPRVPGNGVERKKLRDLPCRHGTLYVLFVGQNENRRILKVLWKTTCRKLPNGVIVKRCGKRKECVNDTSENKEHYERWDVNILTLVAEYVVIAGWHRFKTFVTQCAHSLSRQNGLSQQQQWIYLQTLLNTHSFTYLVSKHFVQLLFGDRETFTVSAVHHQDYNLRRKTKTGHSVRINYLIPRELLILSKTTDKKIMSVL